MKKIIYWLYRNWMIKFHRNKCFQIHLASKSFVTIGDTIAFPEIGISSINNNTEARYMGNNWYVAKIKMKRIWIPVIGIFYARSDVVHYAQQENWAAYFGSVIWQAVWLNILFFLIRNLLQ